MCAYPHWFPILPIGSIGRHGQFVNAPIEKTCEKSSPYSDIDTNDFLEGIREIVTSIIEKNRRKSKKNRRGM